MLGLAYGLCPAYGQTSLADPVGGRRQPVEEMRNTLRPREDYLRSAMVVVRTDPPGCEAAFARDGAVMARPVAGGRQGNTHHCRVFDLPPQGADWQVRVSREGYRPVTLELHVIPRTLVDIGVLLASEFEADRILYACSGEGGSAVGAVLPDGSDPTVVVDTSEADTEPAMNPDGYRLAFCTGEPGQRRIRVFDRRTGELTTVTSGVSADDHRPGWLDAETLVFQRERGGASRIMVRGADGAAREVFAGEGTVCDPCPYPERGTILVATDRFGAGLDIAEGNPATGELARLTDDPGDESAPAARPRIHEVAYVAADDRRSEVRARAVTQPFERPARMLESGATAPAWSSDGRVVLTRADEAIHARAVPAPWYAEPVRAGVVGERVAWGKFARLPSEPTVVLFRLETGAVTVLVDPASAPATAARFLANVDAGLYNATRIHRVAPGQTVQLGCPYGNGTGGGPAVAVEPSTMPLVRGALAPEPDGDGQAATRLFFCLGDLTGMDGLCSPFGRVTSGMDVLEAALAGDAVYSVERVLFDEADVAPGK